VQEKIEVIKGAGTPIKLSIFIERKHINVIESNMSIHVANCCKYFIKLQSI
jgi:hypothetical protein